MDLSSLEPERRKALRAVVVAQCFGMLTQQMLSGGVLLLYLNALEVSPSGILVVLNLIPFLSSLLSLPLAWAADRVGIKRFGSWGNMGMFGGLSMVAASASLGSVAPPLQMPGIFLGLVVHTLGAAFFNAGWFSLLSHIVPKEIAGRYFGLLRFTWQLVALAFFAVSAILFTPKTPVWVYQVVLGFGAIAVAVRDLFYKNLPNAPPSAASGYKLGESVGAAFRMPGFAAYLGYLLLLVCVTGNGPDMLRLSAVRGCGLGDDQVLFLTVASMAGSLLGYATAGGLVDRWGPKSVFLVCHLLFALALGLFPLRTAFGLPVLVAGCAASFLLGLSSSTLGLATIAQSFRVCKGAQRTMAYALISSVQGMASGLSGFALAALVGSPGFAALRDNRFDLVLAGLGVGILLQILCLGLVPGEEVPADRETPASTAGNPGREAGRIPAT